MHRPRKPKGTQDREHPKGNCTCNSSYGLKHIIQPNLGYLLALRSLKLMLIAKR